MTISSAECERRFFALRELKTWFPSSMSQERLNFGAVCHVHTALLDTVDCGDIAKKQKKRQADLLRELKPLVGDDAPCKQTVSKWFQPFEDGWDTVEDVQHTGALGHQLITTMCSANLS